MTIVISLGGSIIVPKEVDYKFLKEFKKTILSVKNKKIVICTGGGFTARDYIQALRKEKLNDYTQDLIGIEVTRLNAKLVASFIRKCNQEIPTTLEQVKELLQTHKSYFERRSDSSVHCLSFCHQEPERLRTRLVFYHGYS